MVSKTDLENAVREMEALLTLEQKIKLTNDTIYVMVALRRKGGRA